MPNLIGYARVSRADQQPEAQETELRKQGAVRIFTEHASGASRKRPQLEACLEYLNPGDTLMVVRLDRLGRSVTDLQEIMDELTAKEVTLKATAQDISTATASGRMFVGMLAVLAEFERDLLSERTKEGLRQARADGVWIGRPRTIDEEKARMYADLVAGGQSLSAVARTFNVDRNTLRRAIRRVNDSESV